MWETHEDILKRFLLQESFSAEVQQRFVEPQRAQGPQRGRNARICIPSIPLPCTVEILLLLPPIIKLKAMLI
jgi:hypothetical protein